MSKASSPTPAEHSKLNVAAPLGFDAEAIPIHMQCSQDPKVSPRVLDPDQLRHRLQHPPQWQPEITDENRHVIAADIIARRQAAGKITQAAVLIPLLLHEGGLSVLLTQRTQHLHDHAGQISFPGGRMDPEDLTPETVSYTHLTLPTNREV